MRSAIRTILVAGLAIGLLAIFLRNADLARVWSAMRAARTDLLALSLALAMATYFVRAERWQYLLQPLGPTRFWVAFRTTVIGFAASFLLPARAGEVLRPYLLAKSEQLPPTAAFATIIVERILDLVTVLTLLALFFLFFTGDTATRAPALFRTVELGGLAAAPVGFGILAAMFVMAGHPERLHALLLKADRILPTRIAHAVAGFARTFAEGLAVVRRPSRILMAMVWSFVVWLLIAAQLWVLARAFAIVLPFTGSFVITAMLVVGVAIPTPGGVGGTHEAFRLGTTSFFGADNDAAVGAAIVQHAVNFVPITLLGLIFVARDGLNMGRLRQLAAEGAGSAARGGEVTS